jgi:hypothetical protein
VFLGCCDILKQVAIVLHFWNKKERFPVDFEPMHMGASVKDETFEFLESLSASNTFLVREIYELLNSLNIS